jgi:hypothetical protein
MLVKHPNLHQICPERNCALTQLIQRVAANSGFGAAKVEKSLMRRWFKLMRRQKGKKRKRLGRQY